LLSPCASDFWLAIAGDKARKKGSILEDVQTQGKVDVQCVQDTGQVTQNGEKDVDEQVCATAALEEDAERGEDDGKAVWM
jgi:hypothetical protein